jgi:hypothetical protein
MLSTGKPVKFGEVLYRFGFFAQLSGSYFMRNLDDLMAKAEAIEHVKDLTLTQRMTLCEAPFATFRKDEKKPTQSKLAFIQFAEQLS